MHNSKKWSIIALAVAILTPVAYFTSTGQMSGLGSSALTTTNVCTEKSQAKKLAEYNNAIKNRDRTQSRVAIAYEQINVLEKRIDAQKLIIQQKEETISQQTKTITELDGYIKKNCTNPKTTQQKNLCTQKKQQKNSLTQNNLAQKSAIKTATSSIRQLEWQIESKKSEITNLNQKIDVYTAILLSYESCEAELGVKFYPACSLLFHTLGIDLNTPCENESWKIFQGYPFGQAWVEYRFILKGSEVKDVSVQSLTFFLGGTDEQKTKFTNIRLSTGIETNDVIAQCERVADSIHCPLSSPITLKKQDIAYWYLNANVDIAEDHSFTLDVGGVNVGGKYDTKNKNQNTKFAITAYTKSPLTGEPGNFNVWETKKDHTIKLGSGSQTLYEFQVKAENGEVAMTDVVLSSEFMEGSGKIPEDFISCADPKLRNQLFDGVLELYDGTMLIATSEDYGQTYTKFDIKNPILIKPNTEKKFTVKAKMQSSGLGTQCSFSVTPNILANSGSFSTHELNYITTIKGTNTSQFRFSSWTCYNGEKQEQGGSSSCKSTDTWRKYAEDFCAQKCSPETGKCGVNSFSNSEPCGQTTVCGNGIVETGEQCDDNNLNSWDGCSQTCWIEWTYPWYFMKTDKQEYWNGDTILLSMSSVSGIKWFVDLYIQPNTWYGSEKGILIAKSIEVNPKTTYKIVIPDHAKIFDETDGYLLVISAAGQARRPDNVNSVPVRVSVPSTILCGNGIKEGPEQCDDGNFNNIDGCTLDCKMIASTSSFEILRPTLGEKIIAGEVYDIEWISKNISPDADVFISLQFTKIGVQNGDFSDQIGDFGHHIAVVKNTGKYSWKVPSTYTAPTIAAWSFHISMTVPVANSIIETKKFSIIEQTIASCKDSDGGKDYYKKWFLEVYNDGGPGFNKYEDTCNTDNKTLQEYSCIPPHGNAQITGSEYFICPNGCSNGACLQSVCWNGIREWSEQCDDGNTNEEDGCTKICQTGPDLCILVPNAPGCQLEIGNISITPDRNNTDNQSHKLILAGTTKKVFSVDVQSQKEPIKVRKVVFGYTSNVGHLKSSQAELWLNGNKVAEAASFDIKATTITFDNVNNLIIPENNSELILVISTNSIGYEKIGVVAKDVRITQVTVSDATGQKSGKDIPQVSTDVSNSSASFSISPALIVPSIVSVLSSSSAQAKIKLIASVGGNTLDSSGTMPTISLDSLTFSKSGNVGVTPTDYVLYEEGKPSIIVNGAASGENIVFDLTAFPHSDFTQSKTYIIVPTMTEGETVSLKLLQNGIQYDIHGINDATDFKSALSQELDFGSRTIN